MKRLAVLLLCLSAQAGMAQKHVQFTWKAGANPGWNDCTTGAWCLAGYSFYEMTSGNSVLLGSAPQASPTYSIVPMPSVGTHVYRVTQTGTDENGAPVESTCNQAIVLNCVKNNSGGRNCSIGKAW